MLLTPLILRSHNWNQRVAEIVLPYKPLICWDKNALRFQLEKRKRHVWPFYTFHLVALGAFVSLSILYFCYQTYLHPHGISIMKIMLASFQFCLIVGSFCTVICWKIWGHEYVTFLNELIAFEKHLHDTYSSPLDRYPQSILRPYDNVVDIDGVFAIFLILVMSITPLFQPATLLWKRLDFIFITFRNLYLNLNFHGRIVFNGLRAVIFQWAILEVCAVYKTLGLFAVLTLRGLRVSYSTLATQPLTEVTMMELRRLCVVFPIIRDFIAYLFSADLAVMYIILVGLNTAVVTARDIMPWFLYCVVVFAWLISTIIVHIVLFLVVNVDLKGTILVDTWNHSCAKVQVTPFQRRLLRRMLRSSNPVRIPYGSLGTFKKHTRTEFLQTLTENSIDCILAASAGMK